MESIEKFLKALGKALKRFKRPHENCPAARCIPSPALKAIPCRGY
jgi:hypothetical protein